MNNSQGSRTFLTTTHDSEMHPNEFSSSDFRIDVFHYLNGYEPHDNIGYVQETIKETLGFGSHSSLKMNDYTRRDREKVMLYNHRIKQAFEKSAGIHRMRLIERGFRGHQLEDEVKDRVYRTRWRFEAERTTDLPMRNVKDMIRKQRDKYHVKIEERDAIISDLRGSESAKLDAERVRDQVVAERDELSMEKESLLVENSRLIMENQQLMNEIQKLKKERDEARREKVNGDVDMEA